MKKFILIFTILSVGLFSSCGVGNYSVSGGVADQAAVSFASTQSKKQQVVATIDGESHTVTAVYHKSFKTSRDIKKTSANTIILAPGQHQVQVYNATDATTPIYNKVIVLSVGEHRIIDL